MDKLKELQEQFPTMTFKSFRHSIADNVLSIEFDYELNPDLTFLHEISINFADLERTPPPPKLIFLLGVMELVSYWKLTCSPIIHIQCGVLSDYEIDWFKNVYLSGLGEMFYLNQLDPRMDFDFQFDKSAPVLENSFRPVLNESSLVMVGGGKDSLVTLKSFKEMEKDFIGFVVNPIPQAIDSIKLFSNQEPVRVVRTICPKFITLDKTRYFNGHIPFSAVLAFIGALVSECAGYKNIVTSNESTANEGNVIYKGLEINHQYSKTFNFESSFRELMLGLGSGVNYYSFLRPLSELQITGLLSTDSASLSTFLSCNKAQTIKAKAEGKHKWCGTCPKCVFTFLSLCPFLNLGELRGIWKPLPVECDGFFEMAKDLCGFGEHKPFECVGSFEESKTGFYFLVVHLIISEAYSSIIDRAKDILALFESDFKLSSLSVWDDFHHLPQEGEAYLKDKLKHIIFKE